MVYFTRMILKTRRFHCLIKTTLLCKVNTRVKCVPPWWNKSKFQIRCTVFKALFVFDFFGHLEIHQWEPINKMKINWKNERCVTQTKPIQETSILLYSILIIWFWKKILNIYVLNVIKIIRLKTVTDRPMRFVQHERFCRVPNGNFTVGKLYCRKNMLTTPSSSEIYSSPPPYRPKRVHRPLAPLHRPSSHRHYRAVENLWFRRFLTWTTLNDVS